MFLSGGENKSSVNSKLNSVILLIDSSRQSHYLLSYLVVKPTVSIHVYHTQNSPNYFEYYYMFY